MDKKIIAGIIGVSAILLVGAAWGFSKKSQQPVELEQVSESQMDMLVREDSWQVATASAQVQIVEFSDLQCPACRSAHPKIKTLLEEYPEEIAYVYRHFPLDQTHPRAKLAAQAAEAGGEQGKFFEMVDLLFENQKEWAGSKEPEAVIGGLALELGLDLDTFNQSVDDGKFDGKIKQGQADGLALGVNSTPTFFVNGVNVGNPSLESFRFLIEKGTEGAEQ